MLTPDSANVYLSQQLMMRNSYNIFEAEQWLNTVESLNSIHSGRKVAIDHIMNQTLS